ncbi:hypothetical protein PWY87_08985 [Kribbella solani]|uniref:hypothetical protein n=1 Tax=Kribbella solani TaxID=236067 RepID=UPI0029A3365D|nr:hypothetical protein [Kribbella solani]MDX3001799.1 hypothetical protein [Kribbella solani]
MKANRTKKRRIKKRWIALVIAALLVVPAVSYVQALLYPGNASFSVRTVEWFRDHGGGSIIDAIETWKYSHQQPPATGVPSDVTATAPNAKQQAPEPTAASGLPSVQLLPGVKPLPQEGTWAVARQSAAGKPLLWTTWFRPDPGHLPVSAAAALLPRDSYRLTLMPGTREPVVGMPSKNGYDVPAADRPALVATFNAGFKMHDSHGGWWTTWSNAVPLVDGRASVVIHRDGSAQIGTWNGTVRMTPDVVAVRQNLDQLIIDGRIVDGLAANRDARWGSTRSQFQYTWRSGLGTDAHGNLIYLAGNKLTLASLATAMHQAGIVRGLELDIHAAIVSFNIEQPGPNGTVTPRKLLNSMNPPANRYLVEDQRDFFYATAK